MPMAAKEEGSVNLILLLSVALLWSWGVLESSLVAGRSTIRLGDELNFTSTLVSEDGNFTLGFFTIGFTDSSTYLGIWYSKDEKARRVWVANPKIPVPRNSVVLTIDRAGRLKITSRGSTVVSIYGQAAGAGSVVATLEDTSNFVLMDETENRTLWQSFDHPSNVKLPGMKLGFNLTSGQNWTLTSWLSEFIPYRGAFTLSWERTQESGELVIRRGGEPYWTSGELKDQQFKYMPMLSNSSNPRNLSYVSANAWNYYIFSADDESFPMLFLNPNGQIVDSGGAGLTPFEFCYGYQSNNGCVNFTVPACRGTGDRFEQKRVEFVGNSGSYDDNSSLSLSDCMDRCWSDCACVAFASNSIGTGCTVWTGDLKYGDNQNTVIKYVLVKINPSKENKWIWIIIAITIFLLALVSGLLFYFRIRHLRLEEEEKKKREQYIHELTASDSFNDRDEVGNDRTEGHNLKIFSFASMVAATNDFSNENKLGQGGFGPVYKGRLPEGREIAIKRLSKTSGQGHVEFKNELKLIAKLQHTNLVRLLGCCIHGEAKMLIYEYMPNKSLDFFLFDTVKREMLDWERRMSIMEGVAQGLLYLHKYSRMRVIHRDLKASNVLLDENMNPKISDFGMARIFKQNESEGVTNRVVGTYGYMSPEYAMEGTFSVKSDVFSFGVLILEIVSGRKNSSFYHLDRSLNLIGYAWQLWKEGTAMDLKDQTLGDSCSQHQVLRTIHVGLLCVQEDASDRPTMSDVISMLSNETMSLPAPNQPAFFNGRSVLRATSDERKSKPSSVNELSISIMEAR